MGVKVQILWVGGLLEMLLFMTSQLRDTSCPMQSSFWCIWLLMIIIYTEDIQSSNQCYYFSVSHGSDVIKRRKRPPTYNTWTSSTKGCLKGGGARLRTPPFFKVRCSDFQSHSIGESWSRCPEQLFSQATRFILTHWLLRLCCFRRYLVFLERLRLGRFRSD